MGLKQGAASLGRPQSLSQALFSRSQADQTGWQIEGFPYPKTAQLQWQRPYLSAAQRILSTRIVSGIAFLRSPPIGCQEIYRQTRWLRFAPDLILETEFPGSEKPH